MSRRQNILALLAWTFLAHPAQSGVIFNRQPKPNPKERVPALVGTLKTEKDEHQREKAALELRDYDPAAFPEIVPVLIETLRNDSKPAVRSEAAQSLGKLRPIAQEAGLALEHAAAHDASMRVRLQAKTSLWSYHFAGYRSKSKIEELPLTPPPDPTPSSSRWSLFSKFRGSKGPTVPATKANPISGETPPPPLAPAAPVISTTQPLPPGALLPRLLPIPSRATATPASKDDEQGPVLRLPPG